MNHARLPIYVVDDDTDIRRSFGNLLLAHDYTVRTFASGAAFLEGADLQGYGVVLLDLAMDGDDKAGKRVFEALLQCASPLVTVFLSGTGTIADVTQVMQGGALDWLEKPCDGALALATVERALQRASLMAVQQIAKRAAATLWNTMSQAERQVAPLVAYGKSAKEIGRILGKEHRTVEHQRVEIFRKVGVTNAPELLRFAMQNGLIPMNPEKPI